jgi:hypothetical protein
MRETRKIEIVKSGPSTSPRWGVKTTDLLGKERTVRNLRDGDSLKAILVKFGASEHQARTMLDGGSLVKIPGIEPLMQFK